MVNQPQRASEVKAVQQSLVRGRPFGDKAWVKKAATRLGLTFTLRDRRRRRKHQK